MEQKQSSKSKRIIRLGGVYKDFNKLQAQLNGRALLVVTIINSNCEECSVKLQKFIHQLEMGAIDKLPQLVMIYGYNNTPITEDEDDEKKVKRGKKPADEGENENGEKSKKLGDSRVLDWEKIPKGHGYGIIHNVADEQLYHGFFNHDEYATNILDNVRRFNSPIKTLAGLPAKQTFIERKQTGIIIETSGITQNSKIIEIENLIKSHDKRLKIPVYICKGINQEIIWVDKGKIAHKQKGIKVEKFLKKTKLL
ncbi:MAG: hypothetical protein GY866_13305 [Proteobacteria bacterium]|nr:hypothetical protein [Pseudomonadota bacterium]